MTARARGAAAAAPRPRPRPAPGSRRAPVPVAPSRRSLRRPSGAVVWLPGIALLLGGIVWVNVAKLQLTRRTSDVVERSAVVQSENIRLNARLEQQAGAVQDLAAKRLGMIAPDGGDIHFLPVPTITAR